MQSIANTAGNPRKATLPLLTSLRFFAAAEVVIFHFFFPVPKDFVHSLAASGFQAVTFFFVLSGFILAYVYSGDGEDDPSPASSRQFWAARAGRILPAYMLGLILALPLLLYGAFISKITPPQDAIASIGLSLFLLQSFWPPLADNLNPPAWSLSVEMVFYALFPLLLRFAIKTRPLLLLAASYGLLIGVQWIRGFYHPPGLDGPGADWGFYKFFPAFHLPTFIFGLALGRVFLYRPRPPAPLCTLLFVAASAALIGVLGFRSRLPGWMSGDEVLVLLYGAAIYAAASPGPLLAWLSSRWLVLLGEASYAMYILHYPLMFWWRWVEQKGHLQLPVAIDFGLFLALVIGVSIAAFLWVERPLRAMIVHALARRRSTPAYA